MEIEILRIIDQESAEVHFRCRAGEARGVWRGDSPATLGTHHIEIDVPNPAQSWNSRTPTTPLIAGDPENQNSVTTIAGTLESLGEDAIACIRVDQDILMIELASGDEEPSVGTGIEIHTTAIHLYPLDL
ncbi:hypothetical protein SLV14_004798 [Streptomyces sp. Je 1-4]|uniref:hypothetical protein n=1 Tax=Streptomyces TaxID=1883 RepID=UPI0021DB3214|nr:MULTISPECIES: hypothetical protein [unclassified Streptomyces]UYB41983.1 hypothetical protein SLV14_004798 [Streptomyces sp. Je 1-4]UZQ38255.1 hypothetical protein SLV14N_004798 [Streptomyces sp. Je 1-4] [Streptomyces sp. Je 1-4 4N24]UZQ45672.1 hypothetical protein SLV14NA_004798 [Streptomyces sp. Je 1-4] [Streptomyces sp. Je 1-4 4N24_ara]